MGQAFELSEQLQHYKDVIVHMDVNYPPNWVAHVSHPFGRDVVGFRSHDRDETEAYAEALRIQIDGVRRLMGLHVKVRD